MGLLSARRARRRRRMRGGGPRRRRSRRHASSQRARRARASGRRNRGGTGRPSRPSRRARPRRGTSVFTWKRTKGAKGPGRLRRELEDDEPASGPEDPAELAEPAVEVLEVPHAESGGRRRRTSGRGRGGGGRRLPPPGSATPRRRNFSLPRASISNVKSAATTRARPPAPSRDDEGEVSRARAEVEDASRRASGARSRAASRLQATSVPPERSRLRRSYRGAIRENIAWIFPAALSSPGGGAALTGEHGSLRRPVRKASGPARDTAAGLGTRGAADPPRRFLAAEARGA